MGLIERVLDHIKDRRYRILNNEINSIPSPFTRFSEDFVGIEQGKYYLITASTKASKTQFTSFVFVYNTLIYAYEHPEQVEVKIFYYPLEETPEDIMERFMCYLLYKVSKFKIRISPTDLRSTKNDKPVSQEIIELLESEEYNNLLAYFEKHIIFSASCNPTGILNECKKYAEDNGVVHTKKQKIKDDFEGTKEIDAFDYYEPSNPNEYRLIIIDHVSLLHQERGYTLKQTIDKLSEYCVILRNRYKFSPVVIQQQAFAGESLDAFKENKIRPTLANCSDSRYPARDGNLAIGIFSPFKHDLKEYLGYDITKFRDNIRFAEILVNRGGSPGGICPLYFDGAVNYFQELPLPNDNVGLNRVYQLLDNIRNKSNKVMIAFGYSKNNAKNLHTSNSLCKFATIFNNLKLKFKQWQIV
jgi:hypothetical protein